jgi:hypothetical protein
MHKVYLLYENNENDAPSNSLMDSTMRVQKMKTTKG